MVQIRFAILFLQQMLFFLMNITVKQRDMDTPTHKHYVYALIN